MNLDALCAQYGCDIVRAVQDKFRPAGEEKELISSKNRSSLENTITKSLGVLQENGVYAFFLFLRSRRGDVKNAEEVTADQVDVQMKRLLREDKLKLLGTEQDDCKAIRSMTNDLDKLLLARQLIERSLVYARYHAKALDVARDNSQRQGAAAP